MTDNSSGGFLPPSIPSPAPSSSSISSSTLPHPRSHALRPGSSKEEAARRYVENRLLHISRRYTKKFQPAEEGSVSGYDNMRDVCKDLGEVVDVLWLSGTPSLQIPYLLNISLAITTYLLAFPPAPTATFALLRKLDHAFASLVRGSDIDSGELLPGFEGGRGGLSRTDMVRCKSLVESTRVLVVDVMSREREDDESKDENETETEAETEDDDDMELPEEDDVDMNIARVYEKTIMELGEALNSGTAYDVGNSQS